MDTILYYIRDNLVGTHYFLYSFILFFLMFSLIGYLFKNKYGKFEIKLASSQDNIKNESDNSQKKAKNRNDKKVVNNITKQDIEQLVKPQTQVRVKVNQGTDNNLNTEQKVKPMPMPNPNNTPPTPVPMPNKEVTNISPTPVTTQSNLSSQIPDL